MSPYKIIFGATALLLLLVKPSQQQQQPGSNDPLVFVISGYPTDLDVEVLASYMHFQKRSSHILP